MSKYYSANLNNIVGKHRKFNPKLHEKFDLPARKVIMEQLGDFVKENPEITKQDFIIQSPTCRYKFLEVQVCPSWVNHFFPYNNVYIHARKAHYGKDNNDTVFLTFNKFLTRSYLFDARSFKDSKPRRIKKYSREFVYDVPWFRAMYIGVEDLTKETIELY
jgi:hypothetical protein